MTDPQESPPLVHPNRQIFLVSVLSLFLEMMFIRWIGTEVRIFAYLQNTVLVVCFLGLGLGAFWCRQPIQRHLAAVPVVVFPLLLAIPWTKTILHGLPDRLDSIAHSIAWADLDFPSSSGSIIWDLATGLSGLFVLMFVIAVGFIPIGQLLGRLLDDHEKPIVAYSINVFGSLIGIWAFALLSAVFLPPPAWMVLALALLVPFLWDNIRPAYLAVGAVFVLGTSVLAARDAEMTEVWWSPYQKLGLMMVDRVDNDPQPLPFVVVNNTGYQALYDLRPESTRKRPELYTKDWHGLTQYDLPYLLHKAPNKVLIAGAGTGNDASAALRNGAQQVTAVDIDPVIIDIGIKHHPENPYSSDKVTVVVDDARSFFADSTEQFDLVSFGLLDAHTMTSLSNVRLDHYIYTRESIAQARSLLKPDGLLSLSFAANKLYIIDRLAHTLREEFGAEPMVFLHPHSNFGFGAYMFIAGNLDMAKESLAANPRLAGHIEQLRDMESKFLPLDGKTVQEWIPYKTKIATDDWPYLYLSGPSVPILFFILAVLAFMLIPLLQLTVGGTQIVSTRWSRSHWHFALLGAGFLLLEVQNISKASVVLGNTWLVSAIIITGVLTMILLANLLVAMWPKVPMSAVAILLISSCVALYFTDLSIFLGLSPLPRAIVVAAVTCIPMLFSGILFIDSFTATPRKDEAFGANLIGSLAGALLQSITYLTGLKFLLIVVAALYLGAIATRPKRKSVVSS
jgi:hypothetical protein